jgi:iron complex transport system permease protein
LAGIAVSAIFSAGLGILKYLADPLRQLPEITFWLLGGLAGVTLAARDSYSAANLPGSERSGRSALAIESALSQRSGGVFIRKRCAARTSAAAHGRGCSHAAVISVAGMVGWVGVIVPHIARRLSGADYASRYAVVVVNRRNVYADLR